MTANAAKHLIAVQQWDRAKIKAVSLAAASADPRALPRSYVWHGRIVDTTGAVLHADDFPYGTARQALRAMRAVIRACVELAAAPTVPHLGLDYFSPANTCTRCDRHDALCECGGSINGEALPTRNTFALVAVAVATAGLLLSGCTDRAQSAAWRALAAVCGLPLGWFMVLALAVSASGVWLLGLACSRGHAKRCTAQGAKGRAARLDTLPDAPARPELDSHEELRRRLQPFAPSK